LPNGAIFLKNVEILKKVLMVLSYRLIVQGMEDVFEQIEALYDLVKLERPVELDFQVTQFVVDLKLSKEV
jgi:hypothetical protein